MAPLVSFSGKDCSGCKHLNDRGYCEFTACIIPCTVRATIPEVKPMSNADRIRQKNDEELAKWFVNIAIQCIAVGGEHEYLMSEAWWLDWLKQEVEDE